MLFSIITVCFNSAKTIRQTFDSVLSQSFKDYEYIIVDGASTDGTLDIIREYEPRFDGRMRWISEPDKGIYDAMNKGIEMTRGEFVNFMNSDDCFENDCLAEVKQWIVENPHSDVYYGISRNMDENGQELYLMRVHHNWLSKGNMICHQSIYMSKKVFQELGGFKTQYRIIADHELCLRAIKHGYSFTPMPLIVCHFRRGGFSTKETVIEAYKKELKQLLIEYGYLNASVEKHNEQLERIEKSIKKFVLFGYKCVRFFVRPFSTLFSKSN